MSSVRAKKVRYNLTPSRRQGKISQGPQVANRVGRRTPLFPFFQAVTGNNLTVQLTTDQAGDFNATNISGDGTVPAWADANGQLPDAVTLNSGGLTGLVELHYPAAPVQPITIPFEDPGVRSAEGGYVVPATIGTAPG